MVGGYTSTQTTCLAIAHTRRPRGIPETVVTRPFPFNAYY